MKSAAQNKPTHIVKRERPRCVRLLRVGGQRPQDQGRDSLRHSRTHPRQGILPGTTLVEILDEYQPSVSNLLKGRISQVSIEKLLRYADRLHLQTSIAIRPLETKQRRTRTSAA